MRAAGQTPVPESTRDVARSARPVPGPLRPVTRLTRPLAGLGRRLAGRPAGRHLLILACYLAAGVAVNWPRASYLVRGELPATRDAGSFVWGFWWMARQLLHLHDPWFTRYLAAPAGSQLGLHVLMPLEGAVMLPVTTAFGPSVSYNLLSAAVPGLMCYAAYRVARLWLTTQTGAIAAGAFFGLSSMLGWRSWYHLNLAMGAVFWALAVEAAVRLRRRPGPRRAVILGVILGACLLTDQESTVLAAIAVLVVLLPWLARHPGWARLRSVALAALVAAVVGGAQLAAVAAQMAAGGASVSAAALARSYTEYGVTLTGLFAPSPRIAAYGLTSLGAVYYHSGVIYQMINHRLTPVSEPTPMFGVVLTVLAVAGLAASWRRRGAWLLAGAWLGAAVLALGPVLWIGRHAYTPFAVTLRGARVSAIMPYTWFVQIPELSGFREAGRLAELGLLPAALLAGAAVQWLRSRVRLLLAVPLLAVVAAAAFLEAGWSGNLPASVMPAAYRVGTMPTAMPALDRPIAADHSRSIVVDFPFGICGGTGTYGAQFPPEAQVLATADGHPRAVAFIARVPAPTVAAIQRHPFYAGLVTIWRGTTRPAPAQVTAAGLDARAMNVGWVLVWPQQQVVAGKVARYWNQGVIRYLGQTGFRFAYQAEGVRVYRAAGAVTAGATG